LLVYHCDDQSQFCSSRVDMVSPRKLGCSIGPVISRTRSSINTDQSQILSIRVGAVSPSSPLLPNSPIPKIEHLKKTKLERGLTPMNADKKRHRLGVSPGRFRNFAKNRFFFWPTKYFVRQRESAGYLLSKEYQAIFLAQLHGYSNSLKKQRIRAFMSQ
jgi:hypothetical protein